MILSSPVDGMNQAAPVTTTFDPDVGKMTMGVASERKAISLPAEDPRAYDDLSRGTWRVLLQKSPTD